MQGIQHNPESPKKDIAQANWIFHLIQKLIKIENLVSYLKKIQLNNQKSEL
jgi:hypothetical protein